MTGDPVQYSCQQNFTIMTTDGYWNAQTETPGGGPVRIDGTTRVGQQDGTLTLDTGLTPRPIWEGFATDTQVSTDNNNQFNYVPCGSYISMSTSQINKTTTRLTADTSQLVSRTVQTTSSTQQLSQTTTQAVESTLQHTQSTAQTFVSTSQLSMSTSQLTQSTSQLQQVVNQVQQRQDQLQMSTSQLLKSTSQVTQSTSQLQQSTLQTRIATSRTDQSTTQITASTSQLRQSTSQINSQTSQINKSTSQQFVGTTQTSLRTSQDRTCDARTEDCTPVATGGCTAAGFFYCETVTSGPTFVASCTAATAGPGNNFVTTTCSTATTGPTATASCVSAPANSGNNYVATTCNPVVTGPTPVATCANSGPTSGNGFMTTTCATVTGALTPTGSCTTTIASAGNSYTAIACSTVTTGPVGVASCVAAPANSGNSYTATNCNTFNTGPTGVSACTTAPANAGNSYQSTSCNTVNSGPTAVSSCTNAAAGPGNSWVATSCTPVPTGPTPIASCSVIPATAGNNWTSTTCPNVVGAGAGVASCVASPGNAGNSFTATSCNTVLTGPTGVASCTVTPAAAGNSYLDTTCNTVTTGPAGAASCTNAGATSGNSYTSTACSTATTGPTPVAACTVTPANAGNSYTATTCPNLVVQNWTNASSCTPVAPNAGNSFTSTTCQTVVTSTTNVATCTPSGPNGSGQSVTCNTLIAGPIGVATCTPQTGNAGNGFIDITCATLTTGPTLVAACTAAPAAAGNSWTATTCANVTTGPTAVASCTAQPAGPGNSFVATTCVTNPTGPTGVQTCAADPPTAANFYVTTSCADVVSGPTPRQTCTAIPAASGNSWVDTSCQTVNTGPTLVASCSNSAATAGNSWTTTSCTGVTTPPTGVSSCTNDPASAGNNYVSTTCATVTGPDVPTASCSPVLATALNSWTETQCVTLTTSNGTGTCTAGPANAGNNWTGTTCNTATIGPVLTAACVADPTPASGNNWTTTACNTITTGPTAVGSCTPSAANAGNNYVATTCATSPGKKISYVTTTAVTTTQFSGPIQIGLPVTTTAISSATDLDGVCYAPGTEPALPAPNPQRAGLAAGPFPPSGCTAWPCTTSTANSGGSVDSLADVAQYYYVTDLRTAALWPPAISDDNVPGVNSGPEDDRVNWQHMTTFTVGLGVSGTLNYRPDYKSSAAVTGDFAEIRAGTRNWPVWPDPALLYDPASGGSFANWNNPKSIDDFWHTAVNGRGTYFNANDPRTVIDGLAEALADVDVRTGSGSGITVSNPEPVLNDNFAYATSYTTGKWIGDVQGFNIDLTTGALSGTANWSAQTKLDQATGGLCDNRTIYLMRPTGAADNKVNFTWNTRACDGLGNPTGPSDTGLNATEMAYFSDVSLLGQYLSMTDGANGTVDQRGAAVDADLVNFLRGQRGREGFTSNDLSKLYRARDHVLGDVVNGQPVFVKGPFAGYQDAGYTAFKTANAGRTPMLYVPANDGMLHAFYAGADATDPIGGKEAWAFIPSAVLPNLYKLADTFYKNNHQFFVDGTPIAGDAFDGTNWRTILIGGLNSGGKSYYALDITDPASPKGLWEFKWSNVCYNGTPATAGSDCHLGATFGKSVISKLSDGTWVVMFTSGYNNVNAPPKAGDGGGYLYVLDAFTGQIRYKIATGAGSSTTPSGLAQINNYVDYAAVNNTTRQVYGGDLLGNVWRFDVNDSIAPGGREASLLGVATDGGGTPQPITTRPELAELNAKPMVIVGTGKLLGASDFGDVQVQSVYGIVDPMTAGPVYGQLRTTFKPLTMTSVSGGSARTIACTGSTVQCGSTDGWVVNLPDSGERVNIDMTLARGTLIFASNVPTDVPCSTGGTSWLNFLNFSTGLAVTTSPNLEVSVQSVNSLATGLNIIGLQGRLIGVRRFTNATNTEKDPIPFDTQPPGGKRISWREIVQ
ncbi:MAG: PilC/PilY family type IV pilus protein [Caldimonas sp.]